MQIMQNPQWGFLGTHQIFNQWQNRNVPILKNSAFCIFFPMFIMVRWLMLLYYITCFIASRITIIVLEYNQITVEPEHNHMQLITRIKCNCCYV